ncbi:WD40 repeat-like protein [Eremomyces bilateralis CBS 781.70]|uniref:WD40 repeat-like protein n=1 Tax=Eremomyces bilateralis CBS 781.70 TaxID=1392243 RepID=A0A6G1G6B6_9PEZI|nr:WD40 repeat-like protein [Eremomyces bilateralis CBS 781.70]KAF1813578.1 WD40 repeat-like protein [Eremomyces bilateralis CBS 781.70]
MAGQWRQDASVPVNNSSYPTQPPFKLPPSIGFPFKMDEGYSEDTRSQPDVEVASRSDSRAGDALDAYPNALLPEWILALGEPERCELAYTIMRSLRTSSIAQIVDRVNPLLHLDPVSHLPPEIVLTVLSNLTAEELIKASVLSKGWHYRALDVQLWRSLFRSEGWRYNIREVREFEARVFTSTVESREKHTRVRRAEADAGRQSSKRRAHEGSIRLDTEITVPSSSTAAEGTSDGPYGWVEQHGVIEADDNSPNSDSDRMQGVSFQHDPISPVIEPNDDMSATPSQSPIRNGNSQSPTKTPFMTRDEQNRPQLDWYYIYKQKRRLEANWNHGRFTNFILPHPDFPEESHNECVYTIQYSDRYLVSGSRDKTLRIWDLETQRLARPPLTGHQASVLCLQFDDSPQEDVIISGGSDCHVKIWRFSDGVCIHTINRAHREPVLNLRFDSRYLITCSKDRTVKVWNRKNLPTTHPNFPRPTANVSAKFAERVISLAAEYERQQLSQVMYSEAPSLKPYELLMTLHGHTAAVNAIQILDGEIVSASGDRTVKIWDVRSGRCVKTIPGHIKGIACVQFDGRRIVSGSSDETVRIFDRVTGAEVACLKGHTNLVRTVQARFGDLPGAEDELEAEARQIDQQYFSAKRLGQLEEVSREVMRARNSGSRDPSRIFAYGAKLPPGGGGSRWARIVSGSYDETVIIWKRNADGEWVVAHQLSQSRAVIKAGGPNNARQRHVAAAQAQMALPNPNQAQNGANHPQAPAPLAQGQGGAATSNLQPPQNQAGPSTAQHPQPQTPVSAQAASQSAIHLSVAISASNASTNGSASRSPSPITPTTTPSQPQGASASASTSQPPAATASQSTPAATPNTPTAAPTQPAPATPAPQSTNEPQPAPAGPVPAPAGQPLTPMQQQHHQQMLQHMQHIPPALQQFYQQQAGAAAGPGAGNNPPPHLLPPPPAMMPSNSRVFKLQFDSRRIICCSQDPTIVGWDFANGDEDIIAASRFFGGDT